MDGCLDAIAMAQRTSSIPAFGTLKSYQVFDFAINGTL